MIQHTIEYKRMQFLYTYSCDALYAHFTLALVADLKGIHLVAKNGSERVNDCFNQYFTTSCQMISIDTKVHVLCISRLILMLRLYPGVVD